MKNLLALGAAGVIGFAGIGWYLGWYKIQTTPTADGHRQISIDLNTPKIKEDVGKGKEKLRDYLNGDDNTPPGSSSPGTSTPSGNPNFNPPPSTTPTGNPRSGDGGFFLPTSSESFKPAPPTGNLPRLPTPQ